MGYSLSWLAVKGRPPQTVRDELGFQTTGQREELPEAALSAVELPNGWYVIVSNRTEQVATDAAMRRLSSAGCELVTCFVEEHVMVSQAAGWKDGQMSWSVTHDTQKARRHLEVQGEPPPEFSAIRDRLCARQTPESCDYIFNIPVEMAGSLTGFCHCHHPVFPGSSGAVFAVLSGVVPAPVIPLTSRQIRQRGLKRLAIGGGIFAAILWRIWWLSAHYHPFSLAVLGAGLPFVFACAGFIDLMTGKPYSRLEQSWMSLRGWQRGILGTFIVIASLVIILFVVTFLVMMFT